MVSKSYINEQLVLGISYVLFSVHMKEQENNTWIKKGSYKSIFYQVNNLQDERNIWVLRKGKTYVLQAEETRRKN